MPNFKPAGTKTIEEILDNLDRFHGGGNHREDPAEFLTLPDYLYDAINKKFPPDDDPEMEKGINDVNWVINNFLGVLGYTMVLTRRHDIGWWPSIITADILGTMLHYWAKYPQGRFLDYFMKLCKKEEETGQEDKNKNQDKDKDEDEDEESMYEEEEESDIEEDEEEDDEIWKSRQWDEELNSFEIQSEAEKRDCDSDRRKRDFYMSIQEHFYDRDMAKNLTKEQMERIDKEVGPGHGNIFGILDAHPTKTGGEMFDKLYPIPPPEFCIDPFEMLPFVRGGMMYKFGRITREPILTLEACCILTKAISAVLFKFYFETYDATLNAKKQQQTIKSLQEEVKNLKQQLQEQQQHQQQPGQQQQSSALPVADDDSEKNKKNVDGKTTTTAQGGNNNSVVITSDDGNETNMGKEEKEVAAEAVVQMKEESSNNTSSKKRKLGSD